MLILLFLLLFVNSSYSICPNGTVGIPSSFGGNWKCISFNNAGAQFVFAELQCMQNNGHLISISDGFVNYFIAGQAESIFGSGTSNSSLRYWIGISNIDQTGWRNVDNDSPTTFFEWAAGEPATVTVDKGCVSMDGLGQWYNDDCLNVYPFVCGILEVGVTTTPRPTGTTKRPTIATTRTSLGPTVSYPGLICPSYMPFAFSTYLSSAEQTNLNDFLVNQFVNKLLAPDIQPASFYNYQYSPVPSNLSELVRIFNEYKDQYSYSAAFTDALTKMMDFGVRDYKDKIPINFIVFTGEELSTSDITTARNLTNEFLTDGHTVTVALVDNTINDTNYRLVTGVNVVNWSDPITLVPNLRQGMKCGGGSQVYHPCKSWIGFAPDVSESLSTEDYNTQMNFIKSAIGGINHPERIMIVDTSHTDAIWHGPYSIKHIQYKLSRYSQTHYTYNLTDTLYSIYNSYVPLIPLPDPPIGFLVFISDTSSPENYEGADQVVGLLSNLYKMKLTFVLMGANVDQSKLTNYTSNFIHWRDMDNPQPDNWDQVYLDAYACS